MGDIRFYDHTLTCQVDRYALEARGEIGQRGFHHANEMREAQARKTETERQIAEERKREGEMLASESIVPIHVLLCLSVDVLKAEPTSSTGRREAYDPRTKRIAQPPPKQSVQSPRTISAARDRAQCAQEGGHHRTSGEGASRQDIEGYEDEGSRGFGCAAGGYRVETGGYRT